MMVYIVLVVSLILSADSGTESFEGGAIVTNIHPSNIRLTASNIRVAESDCEPVFRFWIFFFFVLVLSCSSLIPASQAGSVALMTDFHLSRARPREPGMTRSCLAQSVDSSFFLCLSLSLSLFTSLPSWQTNKACSTISSR